MSQPVASLPGFRDFFPAACAARNYVFAAWRAVAARYGFHEWEGPVLESTDLYRKKSGDEILGQLFHFEDKGGREVALRPELTPTLARLVAARHRDFKKPLKWFEIGSCFRYEAPQKGRLREFYQWNADVLGEASPEADAELIALGIDALREMGFTAEDFAVRLSSRTLWDGLLTEQQISPEQTAAFLQIIDKWDREKPGALDARLRALGSSHEAVAAFIERAREDETPFAALLDSLRARGMREFVRIDPGIVRGLAYYTGTVFEFFSLRVGMRAIAGGGRYDRLVGIMSDGGVDMPAVGFGMGDVVLGDLLSETPHTKEKMDAWLSRYATLEAYVVIADDTRRADALALLQQLRAAGIRADAPLSPAKVGKQFQAAEAAGARAAIVIGGEFPAVKIKNLKTREEREISIEKAVEEVRANLIAQT